MAQRKDNGCSQRFKHYIANFIMAMTGLIWEIFYYCIYFRYGCSPYYYAVALGRYLIDIFTYRCHARFDGIYQGRSQGRIKLSKALAMRLGL